MINREDFSLVITSRSVSIALASELNMEASFGRRLFSVAFGKVTAHPTLSLSLETSLWMCTFGRHFFSLALGKVTAHTTLSLSLGCAHILDFFFKYFFSIS